MPHWLIELLLSATFGCGIAIAGLHVVNRQFVAPVYDVMLNLTVTCAAVANAFLSYWVSSTLAGLAVVGWVVLAVRTGRAKSHERTGVAAQNSG